MLEDLDLDLTMAKAEWDAASGDLALRLGVLQQKLRTLKIPVVIVFEGWGASGKGSMISRLITNLDPRGFSVYSISAPTADEQRYPWMRRFWQKTPAYGDIAIFDRSWYREVSVALEEDDIPKHVMERRFEEIMDFEQQLVDDGYLLLKFFLHISKKEQKSRFKKLEAHKETRWRVTETDWKRHEHYDRCLKAFDRMICRTDHVGMQWIPVAATDKRYAAHQVFTSVISALERGIEDRQNSAVQSAGEIRTSKEIRTIPISKLKDVDLDVMLARDVYREELKACQMRLAELHNRLYLKKIPLILAYEGWDAAGKGGNIKRVARALDPRGYEVIPICAPSTLEKNHHHLWRFWNALPKDGHVAVFDRTWYGRVMVEHIEGFCTEAQWVRSYDEINRFERSLSEWGAVILKFWLHIDKDEQLRRFTERQSTLSKQYKITDEDWRNRERWDDYEKAADEMLLRTNTEYAPWIIIESNDKCYARIKTMNEIISAIEARL